MKSYQTITIDGRCFTGVHNGYTVFTEWVIGVVRGSGYSVEVISNQTIKKTEYPELYHVECLTFGSKKATIWEQRDLPLYLYRTKPKLHICGLNLGLPLLYFGKTKLILGVLDMIPQRFSSHYIKSWKDKLHFLWLQRLNILKANRILTISDASKRDITKFMKGKKIRRVYIRRKRISKKLEKTESNINKARFLYIGGIDFRKRVDILCLAFEQFLLQNPRAELRLVGSGYEKIIRATKIQKKTRQQIIELGRITDKELEAEIRRASAIVFPSLYEGYGLPIAESLMAGRPVICGTGGSQKEVGGSIAQYVDPLDPESVFHGLVDIFNTDYMRKFHSGLKERQDFISSEEHDYQLLEALGL